MAKNGVARPESAKGVERSQDKRPRPSRTQGRGTRRYAARAIVT